MVMQQVCDAWVEELQFHVTGLAGATVHRYASWSSAAIADSKPGLHLAVWPEGDPETARQFTTDGTHEVATSYQVAIWEGATAETTRVFDNDDANAAWIALYEAVKARFYVRTNLPLGDPGSNVRYEGGRLDTVGDKRRFAVRFTKRRLEPFT